MSDVRIEMKQSGLDELYKSDDMVDGLRTFAEEIAARVDEPSHLTVRARAGVSRRGAFAQVIMRGPGALTIEFGNRSRPPKAPLRRAIGGR
ncbi:MAG: hypothetical protein AB7L91_06290 [Dehalococcoidia bacterium]